MNSVITKSNYLTLVRDSIEMDPAECSFLDEKIEKLKEKIYAPTSNIKMDPDFQPLVDTILLVEPGRTLFEYLVQSPQELRIEKGQTRAYFSNTHTISFSLERQEYEILINDRGEKNLVLIPSFIGLAHEMIHAFHHLYYTDYHNVMIQMSGADPEMDNLEEQNTILGVLTAKNHYLPTEVDGICENAFLMSFGFNPRVNHKGFCVEKGESLTLIDYVKIGADGDVKQILEQQPQLINYSQNSLSNKSLTIVPLAASVLYGRSEIFELLMKKGADLNIPFSSGGNLFHVVSCAVYPSPEIVDLLIHRYHLDVNQKNLAGMTPLMCLMSEKHRVGSFYSTAISDQKLRWKAVFEKFAQNSDLSIKDNNGNPPIILAIQYKSTEDFCTLAKYGCINYTDREGNTALMVAIKQGLPLAKISKILSVTGIDLTRQNIYGETALDIAKKLNKMSLVNSLIACQQQHVRPLSCTHKKSKI